MRKEEQNMVELLKDYGIPSGKAIEIVTNADENVKTLLNLTMVLDTQIQDLNDRLERVENRLWR